MQHPTIAVPVFLLEKLYLSAAQEAARVRDRGLRADLHEGIARQTWALLTEPSEEQEAFIEKAQHDSFDYLVGLSNGLVLRVESLRDLGGGWLRARLIEPINGYECPRGLDVRESEILWIADAPDGS